MWRVIQPPPNSEYPFAVNVKSNRIDSMCDTYRLIAEAVPNISVAPQQKCTAAMKTAFDLTRFSERRFRADIWH